MGLQAGRSDMVFYYGGRALHMEFKLPGESQSNAQKSWQALIEQHGFEYVIITNMEQFIKTITNRGEI